MFDIDSISLPTDEQNLSKEITTLHNDNIWEIFDNAKNDFYEDYLNTRTDK